MYDSTKPYKKQILYLIRQTWETPWVSVKEGIVEKRFSYNEIHHSDGIGTKGIYHWRQRSFRNAVIDALAMNLNDLAFMRARPYAVLDHLIIPEDDRKAILEIMKYLAEECRKRSIAITGGETAVHDNVQGLELSIAMLGFVKNPKMNRFRNGDVLLGIESTGLHSNGFTKVREIFGDEFREDFVLPTAIYLDDILELDEEFDIHGMMHITGGGFTKLKSLLRNCDAVINRGHGLKPQEIFFELYERGVSDDEMYKIFNCGIGFVIGINERDADKVLNEIKTYKADVIGRIDVGRGDVIIKSEFSEKQVVY